MIKQIQEINFPSYATLSSATVTLNDMGDRTISAQVKIDGSIVPDFSYDWEVEFKGERYIQPLRQPQASKGNESMRSKIDLVFYHKTIWQLKRYYFVEMTSTESGTAIADQYIASLGLNLFDFCVAFQKVLDHYFDGEISIDLNPNLDYTKGLQYMSISYSYIWDVLQKMYEVYGVRWTIEGNTIKVGYPSAIVSHTFQYGYEGGLLQVERQVQDTNIRNSLLGRGGEQNLPAYYFKEAPEGSLFASDPDAIPELANVYFSNLRGKTFRDYVKGWKAKHYGGTPMSEPTEAYTKGYTDTRFNPIEYVEDKESIKKYGLLQGGLDNNEEIYPSIQGAPNGEDIVVYVEPVTSDDVEQSVGKAETIALNGMSQFRTITRELNGGKVQVALQSEVFEVLEDSYALTIGNNVSYNIYRGFNFTPIWEGNPLVNVEEVVVNKDTNEVANKDSLLKGKYYVITTFDITLPIYDEWPTIGSAENISFNAQLGISTNLQLHKLQDGTTDKWLPTFNIWVKNIWHSTRNVGENDLEYAERVWRPILGDRQGNEAKVCFSSGWLSGHEDYEFTIVDFAYDNSHEHNGTQSEWRLTLAKSDAELDATGKYIPSASTNGQAYAGDTFFFIGIDMPHQYVLWAEERLDNYKTSSLNEVSEIQPKWVVRFDKLRLNEENDNLVEQIKEGNAINLADVRFIDAPALQLYLQSVTYTWNEQTLLYPDIEVVLADTIVPVQNPVAQLQGSIEAINSQLYNIGNVAQMVRKIGDSLYLRKDGVADISKSPTKFVGNVAGNNFRQGKVGGADWGIYRDENRNAIAEFDKIIARKGLEVNNLVINQVSYVGGMQVTSAASIEITRVIENDNAYQCFFDQKGGSVANLFQVNDIAYSQRFDEENNTTKYYKRVVVAVDIDSITLSKSQADGEGVPMANDVVIHYGNTTDTNRQYVIIRDVIGGGYERMLSDLNSVSSSGVEYYFAGRMDGNTPRWFVGSKSQQFIEYKDGHLQIKADVTIGANSDLSASEEFRQVQQDANDAKDTAQNAQKTAQSAQNYIDNILPKDLASLQSQIDGAIDSYFQEYAPTLNNYPANEWDTIEEKESHLNDTFTNNLTGASWRWSKSGALYSWVEIQDTATVKALALAGQAKETADGKSRTFISQPYTPYYEGDLWAQGDGGRLMRCVTSRLTGAFSNEDWATADDSHEYTDSQISSYDLTIKYLKDAFNQGSVLDVNGVTLSALVGVKDENGKVVAGLYGGGSNTLNNAGYADSTHGAMLLFGGIEGVDKPKTYKTAIFEDGFLQSTYFATAKEGKRVEIFGNELKVYGDDANNSVLSISYDSTGKPRLQYTDKSGNVAWYLSDSGISTSYTVEQADNTFVKLAGDSQSITAQHNFANGLKIDGISLRKVDNYLYLDSSLVLSGGVTMYGDDGTTVKPVWESIPLDESTLAWVNGKLSVIGGVGNSGISEEFLNEKLQEYQPLLSATNKLPYSLISNTPDLSVYFLASNFTKSNIKSTLGIYDWALASVKPTYTASEVGALGINDTAANASKLDGVEISNMFKYYGFNTDLSIFKAGNCQTTTHYINNTDTAITNAPAYYGIAVNFGAKVGNFQLFASSTHKLYFRQRWISDWGGWNTLAFTSDIPTKLSQLTDDVVSGNYLSTKGGTVNGILSVQSVLKMSNIDGAYKILLQRDSSDNILFGVDFATNNMYIDADVLRVRSNATIFSQKITAPSFIGELTGNADSATKLKTARTIWGQTFDGTGDITGLMTNLGHIRGTDAKAVFLQQSGIPSDVGNLGLAVGFGGAPNNYGLFAWTNTTGVAHLQVGRNDGVETAYNLIIQEFGGNVAIGGTTADARLHVYGEMRSTNTSGDAGLKVYGSVGSIFFGVGSSGTNRGIYDLTNNHWMLMRDDSTNIYLPNGNVAIGGTTADAKLHVHGTAKYTGDTTFSSKVVIGTIPVYQSADGTLFVDANVVFRGGVAMYGNETTTINE